MTVHPLMITTLRRDFPLAGRRCGEKIFVVRAILAGLFSVTLCVSASDQVSIKRRPPKLPPLIAEPLYGLIVFGANRHSKAKHEYWTGNDLTAIPCERT